MLSTSKGPSRASGSADAEQPRTDSARPPPPGRRRQRRQRLADLAVARTAPDDDDEADAEGAAAAAAGSARRSRRGTRQRPPRGRRAGPPAAPPAEASSRTPARQVSSAGLPPRSTNRDHRLAQTRGKLRVRGGSARGAPIPPGPKGWNDATKPSAVRAREIASSRWAAIQAWFSSCGGATQQAVQRREALDRRRRGRRRGPRREGRCATAPPRCRPPRGGGGGHREARPSGPKAARTRSSSRSSADRWRSGARIVLPAQVPQPEQRDGHPATSGTTPSQRAAASATPAGRARPPAPGVAGPAAAAGASSGGHEAPSRRPSTHRRSRTRDLAQPGIEAPHGGDPDRVVRQPRKRADQARRRDRCWARLAVVAQRQRVVDTDAHQRRSEGEGHPWTGRGRQTGGGAGQKPTASGSGIPGITPNRPKTSQSINSVATRDHGSGWCRPDARPRRRRCGAPGPGFETERPPMR